MTKFAVIGSRSFDNYELLKKTLNEHPAFILLSGGAKGADALAERYARENNYEMVIVKPDWKRHRQGAAIRRNEVIVEQCDEVIAFWDGSSKGTEMVIGYAEKHGKPVQVIRYKAKAAL